MGLMMAALQAELRVGNHGPVEAAPLCREPLWKPGPGEEKQEVSEFTPRHRPPEWRPLPHPRPEAPRTERGRDSRAVGLRRAGGEDGLDPRFPLPETSSQKHDRPDVPSQTLPANWRRTSN